jgi:hypothetical protein
MWISEVMHNQQLDDIRGIGWDHGLNCYDMIHRVSQLHV